MARVSQKDFRAVGTYDTAPASPAQTGMDRNPKVGGKIEIRSSAADNRYPLVPLAAIQVVERPEQGHEA